MPAPARYWTWPTTVSDVPATDVPADGSNPAAATQPAQPIPRLSGRLLALAPIGPRHAEQLFPVLADLQLYRYIPGEPPTDVDRLRERFRRWAGGRSPDGAELWWNWAIEVTPDTQVGYVQATVWPQARRAEIGYVVGRQWQGQGLATEAVSLLLTHLGAAGVVLVEATVDPRNVPSTRLLEGLGFAATTVRRAAEPIQGQPADEAVYRLVIVPPGPGKPNSGSA